MKLLRVEMLFLLLWAILVMAALAPAVAASV